MQFKKWLDKYIKIQKGKFSHSAYSLALSLILHFAFFLAFQRVPKENAPQTEAKAEPIVIEIQKQDQQIAVQKKERKKYRTLVEQEKLNNEVDENAEHLSSHSQKVIKETVSLNRGEFNNKIVGGKKSVHNQPNETPKITTKDLFLSDLHLKEFKKELASKNSQSSGELEDQNAKEPKAAATSDYIKDKEPGLETLLSTREFVYFSYYNRIRHQLNQYWEPKIKDKVVHLFKQGRRVAATEDRITQVLITLDQRGVLQKVQVIGRSGIMDLDEVAIEAFRLAAPFPNPPKGIIEQDGTIKIRWDFIVEA